MVEDKQGTEKLPSGESQMKEGINRRGKGEKQDLEKNY